ncbi:hypothetical protein EOPP23_14435 [Endozoicomonas sp. OPT23]|uniref:PP2C family protein-serine/threonine phosphatase n=1 Tax=Endozoicomonas sp. OPT23 TaxID=2072845 RepID=UPI00129B19D4|nr:SpoIIE family protein phosphatase [Endozoicomonas sp. OPT23]MRI34188.1 hypothetical protein [Endozoicomonas sp. OPT23]
MNILIVEDARDQRMLLSVVLRKKGHTVLEAEDGEQAFAMLQSQPDIRIVISDWMMPGMDGIELLQQVRKTTGERYTYFILLTGKSDRQAVVEGMNNGADDFLVKPVNFEELDARLNAGIRIIELEQQLEQQNQQLSEAIHTIEKDLESAACTQESLLAKPATIQKVDFDWFFKPSKILGGDMFGYHPVDGERIAFYQLDVAGHGIPSALFSFTLNNILSESSDVEAALSNPAEVLASLNNRFQTTPESMLYFTAVYGVINSRTGEVVIAQAGHPPALWISPENKTVNAVMGGGVPVGMMPDMEYQNQTLQLQPGDRLFLYSDGITECEDPQGEQYEEQRLLTALIYSLQFSVSETIRHVEQEISQWRNQDGFDDDVTYLLLEWNP